MIFTLMRIGNILFFGFYCYMLGVDQHDSRRLWYWGVTIINFVAMVVFILAHSP